MRLPRSLLLLVVALPAAGAEVYRSVDENGTVVYSDRPQGVTAERVEVQAPYISGAPAARAPLTLGSDASDADEDRDAEAGDTGPSPAEQAEIRARNCASARERVSRYDASHRLYRELDNGEREYLSSEEIDAEMARAAADVENWCG